MNTILNMLGKDLRRRRRSPLGTLILLLFPLIYAGVLALAFGGDGERVPKVQLLIANQDEGFLGDFLVGAFANEEAAQYFDAEEVSVEDGRTRMEAGEASALLVLPPELTDALLVHPEARTELPLVLELVRNPAQSILPRVAEEITSVLAEILSAGSYVLSEPLTELRPFLDTEEAPTAAAVAAVAVSSHRLIQAGSPYILPPVITLEASTPDAEEDGDSGDGTDSIFLFILPGVTVFSLFMIGELCMRDLITELKQGTLQRQLAGPVTLSTVVASKVAVTAVVATGCLLVISIIAWVQGAGTGDPLAALLLSATLILCVTGVAALLYGLAPDEGRAGTAGSVIFLVMAFTGGSFIPLNGLPPLLRQISPLSPFYWGTDGYVSLLTGGGMLDIAPNALVLALIGALSLTLGASRLHRHLRQGVSV